MATLRLSVTMLLSGLLAACGGGDSATSPTGPSPTPTPTPITVALRLSVAQPSAASDLIIGDPQQGLRTALSIDVVPTGGAVTVNVACAPRGFELQPGAAINVSPPGPVTPSSPFSTVVDVPLLSDFPPPAGLGGFDCMATGTDERGGTVSVSQSIDLPQTATRPILPACTPDDQIICALNDRFRVEVDWRNPDGQTGPGRVQPGGRYDDGGYFYFFNEQNWSVLVQVLNRCQPNDQYWVFVARASNVEYTIEVTDTQTGVQRTYFNPQGAPPASIQDTSAFATCP